MKILIAITKARDIEEVQTAVNNVLSTHKYGVFRTNFYKSYEARQIIRNAFLYDPDFADYTHLAIWPDDLIVTPENIETLAGHLSSHKVICGCCNLDIRRENQGLINISVFEVSVKRHGRQYIWLNERRQRDPHYSELIAQKQPVAVGFAGDPLFIMAREVIEKISMANDSKYNNFPVHVGCCEDVVANYEMRQAGYPIMCDLTVRMKHLKISDTESPAPVLTGIVPAFCEYWPLNGDLKLYQPPAGLHNPISS